MATSKTEKSSATFSPKADWPGVFGLIEPAVNSLRVNQRIITVLAGLSLLGGILNLFGRGYRYNKPDTHFVEQMSPSLIALMLIAVLVVLLLSFIYQIAQTKLALETADGHAASVRALWRTSLQRFGSFAWASLMVGLIVVAGGLLLLIPGIYWAIRYSFVPFAIVDKKIAARDAMKESWLLTKGYAWRIIGIYALIIVIGAAISWPPVVGDALGFVAGFVGSIMLAMTYRWLQAHNKPAEVV